jgi:hypothetical protein
MEDSPPSSDVYKSKEAALLSELDTLEAILARTSGGPFFGGNRVVQADATFAPRVYHMEVALRRIKGWRAPEGRYPHLETFLQVNFFLSVLIFFLPLYIWVVCMRTCVAGSNCYITGLQDFDKRDHYPSHDTCDALLIPLSSVPTPGDPAPPELGALAPRGWRGGRGGRLEEEDRVRQGAGLGRGIERPRGAGLRKTCPSPGRAGVTESSH